MAISKQAILQIILQQIEKLRSKLNDHKLSRFAGDTKALLQKCAQARLRDREIVFNNLRQAYVEFGLNGIDQEIKYLYHAKVANQHFSELDLKFQASLADLRYPTEWYPATRVLQRDIHLHVGPTNSGKTYAALKRLEQAQSGIYAGPLRLLAHEVYDRLNAKGVTCNLLTGDVRIVESADAEMTSCTVEMVPVNLDVEVAVVDEIQMIGDKDRGWAWTQALLGLKAKELHLCGEARAVPLIRELAASMGDKLSIHQYERLNPLKTMSSSLRHNLKKLRKGDCVVAFSRVGIHALRREIELQTGRRVAVVYGSLPPETKTQQAKLFNEPDNEFDFLVASDAIGMGLNLYLFLALYDGGYANKLARSIKRLIFGSTTKFNGSTYEPIADHEIKQIAGRAGRYRTAAQANEPEMDQLDELKDHAGSRNNSKTLPAQNIGLVTTLDDMDLVRLTKAMRNDAEPVMSAGIFPPTSIILRFSAFFPERTPFSYILLRLHELSLMHPRFHLCSLKDRIQIANVIGPVQNLTVSDKIIFCSAPADVTLLPVLRAYAKCVATGEGGQLPDMPDLDLSILNEGFIKDKEYLSKLETLHKALVLYIWLSYRFAGVFSSRAMAFYVKGIVEKTIEAVLAEVSLTKGRSALIRKLKGEAVGKKSRQQQCVSGTRLDEEENAENQVLGAIPSFEAFSTDM